MALRIDDLNEDIMTEVLNIYTEVAGINTRQSVSWLLESTKRSLLDPRSGAAEYRFGSSISRQSKLWIQRVYGHEEVLCWFRFDENAGMGTRGLKMEKDFQKAINKYLLATGKAIPIY